MDLSLVDQPAQPGSMAAEVDVVSSSASELAANDGVAAVASPGAGRAPVVVSLFTAVLEGVREQGLGFICGVWVTLCVCALLGWLPGPAEDAYDVALDEVLHRELEMAKKSLAQCRKGCEGVAAAQREVPVVDLDSPGHKGAHTHFFLLHGIAALGWHVLALFALDVGLVYFCLQQLLSQAQKSALAARVLSISRRLGLAAPAARDELVSSFPAARTSPTSSNLVDPSGGSLLIQRARLSLEPVPPVPSRRRLERARDLQAFSLQLALVGLSTLACAAARLLIHMACSLGLRFLDHLLTYTLVTARVCLVVLLLLF